MRLAQVTAMVFVLLTFAGVSYAQEILNGEVTAIDEASGKISIKVSGSMNDPAPPSSYKMKDRLLVNTVKAGDKVSFVVESLGGEMVIKELTKK